MRNIVATQRERFHVEIHTSTTAGLQTVWDNLTKNGKTGDRIAALLRKVTRGQKIRVVCTELGQFVVEATKNLLQFTKQIAEAIQALIGKVHLLNVRVDCHRINTLA